MGMNEFREYIGSTHYESYFDEKCFIPGDTLETVNSIPRNSRSVKPTSRVQKNSYVKNQNWKSRLDYMNPENKQLINENE
jgi:hypothetical protein